VATLGNTHLTVIIPTFNRRGYVVEAVKSVLIQGIDHCEIIVVDDGSTDGTKDVLRPYADMIRYIHQENQGVSAARNRGVCEARGELLAFLDSDDVWAPDRLRGQLDGRCSGDVISFAGVEWFVDREEERCLLTKCMGVTWPRCDAFNNVIDPILDVAEGRYLHLGTLLCQKETFLKIGLFDNTLCMGEDEDWFSRASIVAQIYYCPQARLRIRYHPNQTAIESEKCIRSLIKVFSNIRNRTKDIHPKAHAAVSRRLADKYSHLANVLYNRGRKYEAHQAAMAAFSIAPHNVKRLIKAAIFSL
jgi:glycosyltransferase involved in cell wall biosynthesis